MNIPNNICTLDFYLNFVFFGGTLCQFHHFIRYITGHGSEEPITNLQ